MGVVGRFRFGGLITISVVLLLFVCSINDVKGQGMDNDTRQDIIELINTQWEVQWRERKDDIIDEIIDGVLRDYRFDELVDDVFQNISEELEKWLRDTTGLSPVSLIIIILVIIIIPNMIITVLIVCCCNLCCGRGRGSAHAPRGGKGYHNTVYYDSHQEGNNPNRRRIEVLGQGQGRMEVTPEENEEPQGAVQLQSLQNVHPPMYPSIPPQDQPPQPSQYNFSRQSSFAPSLESRPRGPPVPPKPRPQSFASSNNNPVPSSPAPYQWPTTGMWPWGKDKEQQANNNNVQNQQAYNSNVRWE